MLPESLLNEQFLKTTAALLPVAAAAWKTLSLIVKWVRNGKLLKLKYIEKEYGLYLEDDEKSFLIRRIRDMATSQIVGVSNPRIKKRLIYVMNRSDLNLPSLWAANIGRFLVFDGVRFYFDTTAKGFKKRRRQSRVISVAYYFYSAMPLIVHFNQAAPFISLPLAIVLSLTLAVLATFLLFSYPSKKQAMSLNGSMLRIDARNYRDN